MMRVEKIASEIKDAQDVLSGPNSPLPQIASLMRRLQRKVPEAPDLLEAVVKALDDALVDLDLAQSGVDAALRATDYDPQRLEKAEERLFALRAAARKHSVPVDDLAALRDAMAADLVDLDAGEERLRGLEEQAVATRKAYDEIAAHLSLLRQATASALEQAVMAELPALKLERAAFIVDLSADADNRGEEGIDQVEFHVRTNPGTRAGSMMKIASGGELSRFLLALKVALAGGAVSDAIGQRLARLSQRVQVMTVTHAPQVAARAATHFLIAKTGGADRVTTSVREMDDAARREEIARMLAGETITEEARAAAARLLAAGAAA